MRVDVIAVNRPVTVFHVMPDSHLRRRRNNKRDCFELSRVGVVGVNWP